MSNKLKLSARTLSEPACRSRLLLLCRPLCGEATAADCLPTPDTPDISSYMSNAVPLRDILTGVFNGSPIPPDYLGEPHTDTDDTDLTEVDPHASFGYSRLDREQFTMDLAARRVDAEGHRARTARARTSNPTGDLGGNSAEAHATTPAAAEK